MAQAFAVDDFTLVAELPEAPSTLPPIVLVHGYLCSTWTLESMARDLSGRGFPAYVVPLSGREGGRPAPDLGRLALQDFADDVSDTLAWVEERHGRRPALVGHSMGGLVAQVAAARREPAALVLIAPAPPRGIPLFNPRLLLRQLRYLPQILAGRAIKLDPMEMGDIAFNCLPRDRWQEVADRFVPDSGRAGREMSFGLVAVDSNRIRCPVLCITGGRDQFIPPRITRRVAARYHAPVWTYPDNGHFIVMEPGADRVTADLAGWLRHVALMEEQPTVVEDLWSALQSAIGEVVDLTFFDGRVLRVEMVNVDLAVRRNVVYRLIEVRRSGSSPAPVPAEGDVGRAALHELAAVTPVVE